MSWLDELKFDASGLVPVVAQQCGTGEVLMLAYANRSALEHTTATGFAHYWSRSRGELWKKGATSGNTQEVEELRADCDGDAVLYLVRQKGPACHTLERSCFHRRVAGDTLEPAPTNEHVLARLEGIVAERDEARPQGSYTTYLFGKGVDKILKKVGEEATEVVIAAKNGEAAALRSEVADLLFHLLVLLRQQGLPLSDVWDELDARFGRDPRLPREIPPAPPTS